MRSWFSQFSAWLVVAVVLVILIQQSNIIGRARADTHHLPLVSGNPQAAPSLPSPFAPPGVVCLPQPVAELVVGATRLIGCTSASRSDPSIRGAVVMAVTSEGTTVLWDAGKDTGPITLLLEQGQVVGRYVVNATGAIETRVIVPQPVREGQ